MAEAIIGGAAPPPGLQFTTYLGGLSGESACPPEYADVPARELFARIDAERSDRVTGAAGEGLAAGFCPRGGSSVSPAQAGSGFESGGVLDIGAPDATLAALADAASRDGQLAELDDDELIGVMRAWQRLEAWCASGMLTAVAELARRRPADGTAPAPPRQFPAQLSEFVGDEIAAATALTARTAGLCQDLALDLALRLPGTARALHCGIIDRAKARLIAEATRILPDEQARAAEAQVLPQAGQQTTGQLRAALARAVLAIDPEAATRRREEAQKDPRVRRWQEDAGTAALAGYGLPPADVLAADQRLTNRARVLRDAGRPGTLEELRARVYLDLLLDRDSAPARTPGQAGPAGPDQTAKTSQPPAAQLTLIVPLATLAGATSEPGHIDGFGPIDPSVARDLATQAANHPASRLCLTVTDTDGRLIGHGCLPGRPPNLAQAASGSFTITINPLARGSCDHRHQEPGYQPSRQLRHLINARTSTCSAPGCQRPAARCDLDHTTPYDQGGRTCECNLAPLCRHHHRCKQADGWRLEQISPGVMRWITPAGRQYRTGPETPL
jgi:hypothetical protein